MANNERYSHDPLAGLPEVTPELIKAYKRQLRIFDEEFAKLSAKQPAVAHELVTGIEGVDPHSLDLKRAFARGVLFMHGLLEATVQAEQLRQMFERPAASDDADDEDPQPST